MNRAPLLSLCMIVRNENETLPDCLSSITGIVDEIVIVDTGSTDDTPNIVKQYGARLYNFPWNDNFSEARNESLKRARGDWIIYLDADEQLSSTHRVRLKTLLPNTDAMGFDVAVRSFLGPEYHWGESTRIFRNHEKIRFEGCVHEQITPSILRLGGKIDKMNMIIEHSGYDKEKHDLEAKYLRNEKLLLKQIQENSNDAFAHYCLGNLYDQMQKDQLAIQFYKKSLLLKHDQPKALFLLGNKFLQFNEFKQAEQCFQNAHDLAPDVSEVVYNLAISQIKQERYNDAISSFRQVLQIRPNNENVERKIEACSQRMKQRCTVNEL